MKEVKRVFVEKKKGFNENSLYLLQEYQNFLGIKSLKNLRLINRYDLELEGEEKDNIIERIFPETFSEIIYHDELPLSKEDFVLTKEYHPGQFNPKLQGLIHLLKFLTKRENPLAHTAEIMILEGNLEKDDLEKIKSYWLNPLEARPALSEKPITLKPEFPEPKDVPVLEYFIYMNRQKTEELYQELGLAMSLEDFLFCQDYFSNQEKRNPTLTEIRIIDTYWSDHCRHKTFFTPIEKVSFEEDASTNPIKEAYETYLENRSQIPSLANKDVCLMDLALIGMRELREKGLLPDLDESEEINAASIKIEVMIDGVKENWLLMFKNETHNHPTEIEPWGGAATCLGGAIRDPLSGRSYIYQAMRISGSGNPYTAFEETLPGKLPQRQITKEAALGYSYYGNQIGVPTGQVAEFYHDGFLAKRMELGAVVAATPQENVRRFTPNPGDYILLLGNKTGRDGCGGAAGSSMEHIEDEEITLIGTEVPKGNPPVERKLLRLFRNPEAAKLIKKCNDFGAGGVSVAIGELADGVNINLDAIPLAYPGLDGTEIAISESQERMAVVIAPENVKKFVQLARAENVSATVVAEVTDSHRVRMSWRGELIVDLKRDFLDTGGIKGQAQVKIKSLDQKKNPFKEIPFPIKNQLKDLKAAWLANLKDLNVASQKPIMDYFDTTAGGGTVIEPYGGKNQATPAEGMVAKIPTVKGETTTGSIMTFGYNPVISSWSPFHGGLYAVVEAVAKSVALGGNHRKIRMTFQEYFERLEDNPEKWGKPFSALLGAYLAQHKFLIPAIGGKDSMSGTWQDLNVPPTLVAFTIVPVELDNIISSDFKKTDSQVVLLPTPKDAQELPIFERLSQNFDKVYQLIQKDLVLAAGTVKTGGLAAALSQMAFGNQIGLKINEDLQALELFGLNYGSIILEIPSEINLSEVMEDVDYKIIGKTQEKASFTIGEVDIFLQEAFDAWQKPLKGIFTNKSLASSKTKLKENYPLFRDNTNRKAKAKVAKPQILIPVLPGTNGEYEAAKAFNRAGGHAKIFVLKDLTGFELRNSLESFAEKLKESQILMLPGGVSGWDEPEGAGKYGAALLNEPIIKEAVLRLLDQDGLILGIGNGFQILLRTGLLPYGEYKTIEKTDPQLIDNQQGQYLAGYVKTKVTSNLSPWFQEMETGDEFLLPISCAKGRLIGDNAKLLALFEKGQIASQYIDEEGKPTSLPTGSFHGIEGITSPDGRILGRMTHPERWSENIAINLPGNKNQDIFAAGIKYFS